MKYPVVFLVILLCTCGNLLMANSPKKSKTPIKTTTNSQKKSDKKNETPSTKAESKNTESLVPTPQHKLLDLDLNCLVQTNSDCRSKEGAKCELLNLHADNITRLQIDEDSTPYTFIAENKDKKCESYWVTEQCRILGGDICDSEQKNKLFGPEIESPSFFKSSFFD